MKNQKGLAPILIILLVAILGIGGYFVYTSLRGGRGSTDVAISPSASPLLSPTPQPTSFPSSTPDETANWKAYTSSKLGYTIKYPVDKFIDCSVGDSFALYYKASNDTICAAGEGIPNLSIVVFDKNKEAAESRFSECYSAKQEMVKIGDITGTKYTNTRNTNDACGTTEIVYARSKSYILINHGGSVFQIILDEFSNQALKITQVIDQILSTFKFTQ